MGGVPNAINPIIERQGNEENVVVFWALIIGMEVCMVISQAWEA